MFVKCALLISLLIPLSALADTPEAQTQQAPSAGMNNQRLQSIIDRIGSAKKARDGYWVISFKPYFAHIITDEKADRMRIIVPITEVEGLDQAALHRILQANFDSALDARYSVAQGKLWSAFIHPLSSLTERDFISGLAQTFNLVATYGKTYSSGALVFSGGDSQTLNQVYQDVLDRFNAI